MKDYQKPAFELISLVAQEKVTSDMSGDVFEGDTGVESNNIFP